MKTRINPKTGNEEYVQWDPNKGWVSTGMVASLKEEKEAKAPTTKNVNIDGVNYVHQWHPDKGWVNTGMKSAVYNTPKTDANAPQGYTRAVGLGSKGLSYLFDNGLATNVAGNVYARPEDLQQAKQLEDFGNQVIEVR